MRVFATGWSEGYDGPGRRRIVYLKGCNFRCRWCASPEGISPHDQMLFYRERSSGSEGACPFGAVRRSSGRLRLARSVCATCTGKPCVNVFRHPAFEPAGAELSPEQIAEEAAKSRMLFGRNGGVTFGGGEPTCQMDGLLRALRLLRRASIGTAVETNAFTERFAELVGKTDLLICDLKAVSARRHKAWTGRDNAPVLRNLRLAARRQEQLWIRIPVVPGLNDGAAEWKAIVAFVKSLARNRGSLTVELLRFHHNGEPKYRALGLPYPMRGAGTPSEEKTARLAGTLRGKRLTVRVGAQVW